MAALALCALGLLTGCPRSAQPAPGRDAGPVVSPDAGPPPGLDTDLDGLCDVTEHARGTDPTNPDTDGDGISDRVEVDLGFDPTRRASPDASLLVQLSERLGSTADVTIVHTVRGQGDNYTGAFRSVAVADAEGVDAGDFYERSIAVGAVPMENVFEVLAEEERITGVVGRTRLVYAIELAFAGDPRGCRRAYPFRYLIKRDGGTTVTNRRYVLIVLPENDDGTWCPPLGGCI